MYSFVEEFCCILCKRLPNLDWPIVVSGGNNVENRRFIHVRCKNA